MPWGVAAAAAGAVITGAMSDDYGAEGANNAAADSSRQSAEISREQWDRYKKTYLPLEEELVNEAKSYDSPANYALGAGEASATVTDQFGKARDRIMRTPGIDPSSAGFASSMVGLDLAQAATDATQQNLARKNVKDTAYLRKQSAVAMGKGLDSTAATGLSSNANQNMAMAGAATAQANQEAGALGRVTSNVISALPKTGWFDSKPATDSGAYIGPSGANGNAVYTDSNTGATFNWADI